MDLIKLNKTTFKGVDAIQGYDSFVWTERYAEPGEFEINIPATGYNRAFLPLGDLISHTETRESMFIEDHEISTVDNKRMLRVTGRSFDSLLDHRFYAPQGLHDLITDDKNIRILVGTPANKAKLVIDGSITGNVGTGDFGGSNTTVANTDTEVDLRNAGTSSNTVLEPTYLNDLVMSFLGTEKLGLHTKRPIGSETDLILRIHDGEDFRTSVIFYEHNGDLIDPRFFESIKDNKTSFEIVGYNFITQTDFGTFTGVNRRTGYIIRDEFVSGVDVNPGGQDNTTLMQNLGRLELTKYPKIRLLETKIASTSSKVFGVHYNIGDLVKVIDEQYQSFDMRVTEHAITYDKQNGISSFATLNPI